MKFFNLDLHISVIADIKNIFQDLGHEVDDWTLSGHSWVMGRTPDKVDIINANNWRSLDKDLCDAFYKRYRDELNQYDGFICTYAPSFCLLYEKFKKPIITVVPIRYEAPFWNNKEKWEWYNQYLRDGIDNGLIIPIANNKCDKEYCEVYTQREWKHIPSLCKYTESVYEPKQSSFLYHSLLPLRMLSHDPLIQNKKAALGPNYKWHELTEYRGMIHIPYNISTMSIFENYTSGMPMFFPSLEFILKLRKSFGNRGVLSQLSWREVQGLPAGTILASNNNIKNLNNYGDIEEERPWIELADFYDKEWMPYINYFDSFPELSAMLNSVDTLAVSQNMLSFNKIRKQRIYHLWEEVLKELA